MKRSHSQAILSLASAALLASMLAGCSGNGNANGGASPSPSASSSASAASPSASPSSSPSASAATQTEGTPSAKKDDSAALVAAFQTKVKGGATATELNKLMDESIPQASADAADEIVREMIAYYDTHLQDDDKPLEAEDIQQSLMNLKWPFTADQTASIKDEKARKAVEDALAGGYKLETAEGSVFLAADYGKLKRFDAKLSPEMQDYVALLALESDAKSAADGALVISWDELASRALAAENFLRTYPEAKEKDAATERFNLYLEHYLIGLPNTPIFDFDTFKIAPDVKASYEKVISEHPDSAVASLAKELLGILQKTNGAVFTKGKNGEQVDVPEVKAFRDQLREKAEALLAGAANPNK